MEQMKKQGSQTGGIKNIFRRRRYSLTAQYTVHQIESGVRWDGWLLALYCSAQAVLSCTECSCMM